MLARSTTELVAVIEELSDRISKLETAARQPMRTAYRPREVARMTGIGYDMVLHLIKSGELSAVKVGRLNVVPADSVDRLLGKATI